MYYPSLGMSIIIVYRIITVCIVYILVLLMQNLKCHAGGDDEISFDPDDIIENIEQVPDFSMKSLIA